MGKVLFIRGGAIGDFVLTMPAMHLLRTSLPDNEVEILGDPGMAELALSSGLADRARTIHDPRLAPFYAPQAALDPDFSSYFTQFDLVLSYLYDPDCYFEENLRVAGVETLFSFPGQIDDSPGSLSAVRQLAEPLEQLALFLEDPHFTVDFGGSSEPADKTIVIHPGSGDSLRNWGFENWINLISKLHQEKPELRFQLVSGPAEEGIIEDLRGLVDERKLPCEFLSNPEFLELARSIGNAALYLGQDSGISQLAASTGSRGVLLYGPRDPEIWAPVSNRMRCIRPESGLLHSIPVSEVLSDAMELLES